MTTPTPRHGPDGYYQSQTPYQPGGWPAPPPPRQRRGGGRGLLIGILVVVGLGVAGIVGLTALGALVADAGPQDTVQTSVDAPSAAGDAAAGQDAAGDSSNDDGIYKFGQTATFEDGSTLTVAAPVAFKPDEFAFGGEKSKHHVKFKVTFVNKTPEVFDPTLTTGSVTSGETEGESVYQDGLDAPDNKVLPGKKITWWMGYGVDNPKDLQLTVSVGFLDYKDVIFTS